MIKNQKVPIVVDLDGTIIYTDCLWEQVNRLIFISPISLLRAIYILILYGKAEFKYYLANSVSINVCTLPYNVELIEWLKTEKLNGGELILATASNHIIANNISNYLGIFDRLYASSKSLNLNGKNKSILLCDNLKEFDYVGNSKDDYHSWLVANRCIYVGSSRSIANHLLKLGKLSKQFRNTRNQSINNIIISLRPHQWIKNILVFLPVLAAHHFTAQEFSSVFIAFIAFCLTASSGYIINDLSDIDNDRLNTNKKNRPFASGSLSLGIGWFLLPFLLAISIILAQHLPEKFALALLLYLLISVLYTKLLKKIVIVDVIILSILYIMRMLAGGAAISLDLSFWLLNFSLFFFFSLGMVKRFSELISDSNLNSKISGRGYYKDDSQFVLMSGLSSAIVSVAVLALYIKDLSVSVLYRNSDYLMIACPIMLFWVLRIWLKASRSELHYDPVYFAARDKVSWVLMIGIMMLFFYAI